MAKEGSIRLRRWGLWLSLFRGYWGRRRRQGQGRDGSREVPCTRLA